MNFKKWVKSIQTVGYNGERTVIKHDGKGNSEFAVGSSEQPIVLPIQDVL